MIQGALWSFIAEKKVLLSTFATFKDCDGGMTEVVVQLTVFQLNRREGIYEGVCPRCDRTGS